MVNVADSTNKIPPPPAAASKEAVRKHIVDHIYEMHEFIRCATHVGLHARGGPPAVGQLDKARVEALAIVARLPPIQRYNVPWVLRLANASAAKAWELLSVKGPRKRTVPVPAPAPAPARSVSGTHKPRARQPLASGPYDRSKRPAKRVAPAPSSQEDDDLAEWMRRTSLDDAPAPTERILADAVEELCGNLSKTHIAPPVPTPAIPAPVPTLFAPIPAVVPVPAAVLVSEVTIPPPSAPRRTTVDLPEVNTAPVIYAPAVAPEPLIYVPCARTTRAPAPARSPYNKAARPALRKPVKLAPPPEVEVPYIEAVTETFSGEHVRTEVHILDARLLHDGRLARRESRGWRSIAVA